MGDNHFPFNFVLGAGTLAVGTTNYAMTKAPADALGGGFTITELRAVSSATLAAGSAWGLEIVTMASTGTISTLNGTVGTIPGTGAWTANVVRTIAVADGWVDGGEYVGARFIGTAENATSHTISVFGNAVMGR
jgi:hypothetical protein